MTWTNYDDVANQLSAAGLILKDGLRVGTPKPVRCRVEGEDRENRGWYWLDEIWLDGDSGKAAYLVGAYGVYHGNDNGKRAIELRKDAPKPTPEQQQALAARRKEQQKRLDAMRRAEIERAARHATHLWKKSQPTGHSDYLQDKGIQGYGVRYTEKGSLVIALCDDNGKVYGVQFVGPEVKKRFKDRNKTFLPAGFEKKGHYFIIGAPTDIILIVEGYATAATLHEAVGLCVVVAFDAGNLGPVSAVLHKRYPRAKILFCADDDYQQKCRACHCSTPVDNPTCAHCGQPHGQKNPGIDAAQTAAMAIVGAAWVAPAFSDDRAGKKITDYNDLHQREGLHTVRAQLESKIEALGWRVGETAARGATHGGAGNAAAKAQPLKPLLTVEEAVERYSLVYGGKGVLFDHQEHMLVPKGDVQDILEEHGWRDWKRHPKRKVVRLENVGFDPAGEDGNINCNLWGGWPTSPKSGSCERLLELLSYLCNGETKGHDLYQWVLCWLAYPIQNPGAKMQTALIFHGGQGAGKNLFFEAYMRIFGPYGRIIGQDAIEDKFNDWASRKLFLIADEVVARSELYHQKNKLKSFVTGEWIRINPKNVTAYDERNHVNLVFLSNETQPGSLEYDDRRYAVVKTPEKLPAEVYAEVAREVAEGGVEALHHYLLHLDLADFKPWTKPLMTDAKRNLIDLSLDSTERFRAAWMGGEIDGVPLVPCKTEDLFGLFREWCRRVGIYKHPPLHVLVANLTKRPDLKRELPRYYEGQTIKQASFIVPSTAEPPPGRNKTNWYTDCVEEFRTAVGQWKDSYAE